MSEEEDFYLWESYKMQESYHYTYYKVEINKKKIEFVMTWITFLIEYILALIAYKKKMSSIQRFGFIHENFKYTGT